MRGSATVDDLDEYLDDLAPLMTFKLYTQICFCFAMDDGSSDSGIINILIHGLERLSTGFPWLAGQVIQQGSDGGILKIRPLDKVPRLFVQDLRLDPSAPTMDALRRAKFPSSMLDESIIAPCNTLPGLSEEFASNPAPVLLLQANFITGGLLLTIVGLHCAMDMVGQGQIMHLFSKACRKEEFTSEELSFGNLSRRNLVPLLDESNGQSPELAHQIRAHHPSQNSPNDTIAHKATPAAPTCTRAYFTFHATSLASLKTLATESIIPPVSYISTDDALSAFIWQSVLRARIPRLDPTAKSTFTRAVDIRPYFKIPQLYPGLMQNLNFHTYSVETLVETPLGAIASQLRSAVDPKTSTLVHNTRALTTFLNCAPDRNDVSIAANMDLSVDLMLSSWAKVNCYDLDYNLGLGKPEVVRRPQFTPVESLIYLLPKALDGEIAVAVCLRDVDMERLRADEQFMTYASYIG